MENMWLTYAIQLFLAVFVHGEENSATPKNLIHGGKPVKITDAPYFALYFHEERQVCGASIIHRRFLVTAAHCYDPTVKNFVKVGTDRATKGHRYSILRVVIHPKYDLYRYDVAVIQLVKRLRFNGRVGAIQMAARSLVLRTGNMLTTMGFGITEKNVASSELLGVDVPYISNEKCNKIISNEIISSPMKITDEYICAGGVKGYDSCNGDSGSPLIYKNLLVGIVSFSLTYNCGTTLPAGYSRLSVLRDFVDATVDKFDKPRKGNKFIDEDYYK